MNIMQELGKLTSTQIMEMVRTDRVRTLPRETMEIIAPASFVYIDKDYESLMDKVEVLYTPTLSLPASMYCTGIAAGLALAQRLIDEQGADNGTDTLISQE